MRLGVVTSTEALLSAMPQPIGKTAFRMEWMQGNSEDAHMNDKQPKIATRSPSSSYLSSKRIIKTIGLCSAASVLVGVVVCFVLGVFHFDWGQSCDDKTRTKMSRVLDYAELYILDNPSKMTKVCDNQQSAFMPSKTLKKYGRDQYGKRFLFFCKEEAICARSFGRNMIDENGAGDDLVSCRYINKP